MLCRHELKFEILAMLDSACDIHLSSGMSGKCLLKEGRCDSRDAFGRDFSKTKCCQGSFSFRGVVSYEVND